MNYDLKYDEIEEKSNSRNQSGFISVCGSLYRIESDPRTDLIHCVIYTLVVRIHYNVKQRKKNTSRRSLFMRINAYVYQDRIDNNVRYRNIIT